MRRALLLVLLLASPALAQPAPEAPHREGDYGGVTPGEPRRPDPSARPARSKRPPPKGTLSWIGFEAKDGAAQVFLQASAPFDVHQRLEGSTLVVHLSLTRLGTNTWRHVDTRFFENPLATIVARTVRRSRGSKSRAAQSKGIEVRIAFKNPADAREATVRAANEADGMSYVYLTFPPGTAASPGAGTTSNPAADDVGD